MMQLRLIQSRRSRIAAMALAVLLVVAVLVPAVASATYNRAWIKSWTPNRNVPAGTRTRVKMELYDDDTGKS